MPAQVFTAPPSSDRQKTERSFWRTDLGELLFRVAKWVVYVVVFGLFFHYCIGRIIDRHMGEEGFVNGGWIDPATKVFVPWEFFKEMGEILKDPERQQKLLLAIAAEEHGRSIPDSEKVYSHVLHRPITKDDYDRIGKMGEAFLRFEGKVTKRERRP